MILKITKFLFVFVLATFFCAWCWGAFVADSIYNCTDSMPSYFDYLVPGDWVHAWKPVESVTEVRTGRSMSEPDVLKQGWTVSTLWCLWGTMVGTSAALAVWAARTPRLVTSSPTN